MNRDLSVFATAFLFLVGGILAILGVALADEETLPNLGLAPDFALTSQDGDDVTLGSHRGKVVAVTFIYTWCPDICPMLTDKMAQVQDALGDDFGNEVAFVSISFDPERDTPEVLRHYAAAFDADLTGWSFLTGELDAIRDVARRYGVVVMPSGGEAIDHSTLTTLIDRHGVMRVQYVGYRFDSEELRQDLLALVNEP